MANEDRSVHITGPVTNSPTMSGNFQGPVNIDYSGSTTSVNTGSITINQQHLEKMSPELAESLQKVVNRINKEIGQDRSIPQDRVKDLQSSTDQLAKEMSEVKPQEAVTASKRHALMGALINFGRAVAKASPKIAQVVMGMTPLAPLSGIVGESLEKIVKEALSDDAK